MIRVFWRSALLLTGALLAACESGPSVSRIPTEARAVDAPYGNVLVVSLFESREIRNHFERQVASQLLDRGVKSSTMTSYLGVNDEITREAVTRAAKSSGADAILVTQLLDLATSAKKKDKSPQGSYKFGSTMYFNVFTVEQKEFIEPPSVELTHDLTVLTDLYSAGSEQKVWAIGSSWHIKTDIDDRWDFTRVDQEATSIVGALKQDGLVGRR